MTCYVRDIAGHVTSCDLLQDILYCYPKDALASSDNGVEGRGGRGESTRGHLLQLRGVFLTLSDVMASITTEKKSW